MRYALVSLLGDSVETVKRYLPGNYTVIAVLEYEGDERMIDGPMAVIAGRDNAGWTLEDYVLPRLASGLIPAREVDLSHPVMKLIPEKPNTISSVRFEDPDPAVTALIQKATSRGPAQLAVIATFEDGTEKQLFSWYTDELAFTADEFEGLTEKQARDLFLRRDTEYLRS